MARFYAWMIGLVTGLQALGVFALAQDAFIPATVNPPGPPPVYRLSLEEAQRIALANNTGLTLGRLGVQEKSIAVDAARRDYLPKLLGNFNYRRFPRREKQSTVLLLSAIPGSSFYWMAAIIGHSEWLRRLIIFRAPG